MRLLPVLCHDRSVKNISLKYVSQTNIRRRCGRCNAFAQTLVAELYTFARQIPTTSCPTSFKYCPIL